MSEPAAFSYDALLSKAAAAPVNIGPRPKRGKYDFAVAYPDPASLPLEELTDALAQALSEEGRDLAIYAHPDRKSTRLNSSHSSKSRMPSSA